MEENLIDARVSSLSIHRPLAFVAAHSQPWFTSRVLDSSLSYVITTTPPATAHLQVASVHTCSHCHSSMVYLIASSMRASSSQCSCSCHSTLCFHIYSSSAHHQHSSSSTAFLLVSLASSSLHISVATCCSILEEVDIVFIEEGLWRLLIMKFFYWTHNVSTFITC